MLASAAERVASSAAAFRGKEAETPEPEPAVESIADRLVALSRRPESGALSDEEFARAKEIALA